MELTCKKSLDDVPQDELAYMGVKLYIIGSLVWDYTDSVLDLAAQMKIPGAPKKLSRAIREVQRDYNRIRSYDLDAEHVEKERELAELFEDINRKEFSELCKGLVKEIREETNLNDDYVYLVEGVQMAMTVLDTLVLYAAQCDTFIRKYYPRMPHSILPDHFKKLAILLPEYAGDCYNQHSKTRARIARALLDRINEIELYG